MMDSAESNSDGDASERDETSLTAETARLADAYQMMQKGCMHRLSKIAAFVRKIGDTRGLCENGCKWVNKINKEAQTREKDIGDYTNNKYVEEENTGKVLQHNTSLHEIEKSIEVILLDRTKWLNGFVLKVEEQYDILDKIYEDISDYAVAEVEKEDHKVCTL